MSVKKNTTLEDKTRRCLQAEARGRKAYGMKDRLLAEIAQQCVHCGEAAEASQHATDSKNRHDFKRPEVIELETGEKYLLVDNFAKAQANERYPNPTLWGMAGSRQFELEKVKG